MSSNFTKLTPAQSKWAEKILNYGISHGYGPDITKAAISLALQESDLGRYENNLAGSSATGLYQFMGVEDIKDELVGYRTNHPNGEYANWSAAEVFRSKEATMAVMFDKIERWKQEFTIHYLPSHMERKLHNYGLETPVHKDFNTYAYLRHNTSPSQVENRLHATNGIEDTNAAISTYVDRAFQQAQTQFSSYKIAVHQLKAPDTLAVLHTGAGRVELPNGFPVTLSNREDYVVGIGERYVIRQGLNDKYVNFEINRMVESRPSAFLDTEHQNKNMPWAAGKLIMKPNGDVLVDAYRNIFPYLLKEDGYTSADGASAILSQPPLRRGNDEQSIAVLNQHLAQRYHGNAMDFYVAIEARNRIQSSTLAFIPGIEKHVDQVQQSLTGNPAQNLAVMRLLLDHVQQQQGAMAYSSEPKQTEQVELPPAAGEKQWWNNVAHLVEDTLGL